MAVSIDETSRFMQWMATNVSQSQVHAAESRRVESKGSVDAHSNSETCPTARKHEATRMASAIEPTVSFDSHSKASTPARGANPPPCTPATGVTPGAVTFDSLSVILDDEHSVKAPSHIDSPLTSRASVTSLNLVQDQIDQGALRQNVPLTSANLNKLDDEPDDPTPTFINSPHSLTTVQQDLLKTIKGSRSASDQSKVPKIASKHAAVSEDHSSAPTQEMGDNGKNVAQTEPKAVARTPPLSIESPSTTFKCDQTQSALSISPETVSATMFESPTASADTALQGRTEKLAPTQKGVNGKNVSHENEQIPKTIDVHEGDRTHLTHFESWGTPPVRTNAPAKVRTIILSHLPLNSDLTLVQSIVHGGSIERMIIHPSGTTAEVTFTSAEACDKYYDEYPNGIAFKHKGAQRAVSVEKAQQVDVVSGILQAQLECGASRVVRATGADPDWTMRALHKIASGNKDQRKVESINDMYREEVRTIIFRFTNISDAVAFRGLLRRDAEWDGCNIQFSDDPCEIAKAIHMD